MISPLNLQLLRVRSAATLGLPGLGQGALHSGGETEGDSFAGRRFCEVYSLSGIPYPVVKFGSKLLVHHVVILGRNQGRHRTVARRKYARLVFKLCQFR